MTEHDRLVRRRKDAAEFEQSLYDCMSADSRKYLWGDDYYAAEELKKKRKEMNAKQRGQ